MKEIAGTYPTEKTTSVKDRSEGSSQSYRDSKTCAVSSSPSSFSSYASNKTAEIKTTVKESPAAIKPNPEFYPAQKTTVVSLKQADKPLANENKVPAYQAEKTVSVIHKSSPTIPVKEEKQVYPVQKTANIQFKNIQQNPVAQIPSNAASEKVLKGGVSAYSLGKTTVIIFKTNPSATTAEAVKSTEHLFTEKPLSPNGETGNGKVDFKTEKKAKNQPVMLLTVLTVVFFISTVVLAWLYWNEHKQLVTDREKLNELTNIKVDDVIGGGLKSNAEFALTTKEVSEANFIRVCFSLAENAFVSKGEKIYFVRLINSDNKVVPVGEAKTFTAGGKSNEFTFRQEVNYSGKEIFLCKDIEKSDFFKAGNYNIEIYSEGSLRGTASFKLE